MSDDIRPFAVRIVGWSNSGKTTLIERLTSGLTGQGLQVGTIKHASHRIDLDRPGKDSYRHQQAGALRTVLLSPDKLVYMEKLAPSKTPPSLAELVSTFHADLDVVLIEGFGRQPLPCIEVLGPEETRESRALQECGEILGTIRSSKQNDRICFAQEEVDRLLTRILRQAGLPA